MMKIANEIWKDIAGYNGVYQVSNFGNARRAVHGKRDPNQIRMVPMKLLQDGKIQLRGPDGKTRRRSIRRIVWETFRGAVPEGMFLLRRKFSYGDALDNLYLDDAEACGNYGGHQRNHKTVVKIDRDGNVIEFYRNCATAARENNYTTSAISLRCRRKIKEPFRWTEYDYRFESDYLDCNGRPRR